VRRQGVTVEKGSSSFLQVLAFYSPTAALTTCHVSNYVTLNVLDALKRVPGTTNVQIFGAKDYAMRIWLKPGPHGAAEGHGGDIARALQRAERAVRRRQDRPVAHRRRQEMVYTITTKGRCPRPREFEHIILRSNPDGSTLRLRDVARVELGAKDYDFNGKVNGKPPR
jgi:multidrug efflux pump subunit AcrB